MNDWPTDRYGEPVWRPKDEPKTIEELADEITDEIRDNIEGRMTLYEIVLYVLRRLENGRT